MKDTDAVGASQGAGSGRSPADAASPDPKNGCAVPGNAAASDCGAAESGSGDDGAADRERRSSCHSSGDGQPPPARSSRPSPNRRRPPLRLSSPCDQPPPLPPPLPPPGDQAPLPPGAQPVSRPLSDDRPALRSESAQGPSPLREPRDEPPGVPVGSSEAPRPRPVSRPPRRPEVVERPERPRPEARDDGASRAEASAPEAPAPGTPAPRASALRPSAPRAPTPEPPTPEAPAPWSSRPWGSVGRVRPPGARRVGLRRRRGGVVGRSGQAPQSLEWGAWSGSLSLMRRPIRRHRASAWTWSHGRWEPVRRRPRGRAPPGCRGGGRRRACP